jgi:hypothetical protein
MKHDGREGLGDTGIDLAYGLWWVGMAIGFTVLIVCYVIH